MSEANGMECRGLMTKEELSELGFRQEDLPAPSAIADATPRKEEEGFIAGLRIKPKIIKLHEEKGKEKEKEKEKK